MKIGILGAGQLGRMLAIAGAQLGFKISLLDSSNNSPSEIFSSYTDGDLLDETSVKAFAASCDVVTAEFENISAKTLEYANSVSMLLPSPEIFKIASDRLLEKELAAKLGIPIPKYISVSTLDELSAAATKLPNSLVKSRSLGYDGKSQTRLTSDLKKVWEIVGERPSLVEEFFKFDFELSQLAVRARNGEIAFYDLAENTHKNGILIRTVIDPNKHSKLKDKAAKYVTTILNELGYVGVLAVEFFVKDSELYLNELAPRVHNTGHWTIEGAETSQFENHLRAISGLSLGTTQSRGVCEMVNIIGQNPDYEKVLNIKNAHLHMYGKEPRPGRKLGHITVTGTTQSGVTDLIQNLL